MIQTLNPHFQERIRAVWQRQHFNHHIGFELTEIEVGHVEGWLTLATVHQQARGFAHGGLVATLADTVAGFAAASLVGPEEYALTAELKVMYLNPGVGERLHAVGWVIKQGRRFHFCEAEIWAVSGDTRTLVAKASATMAVVEKLAE